jgi:hypothetical protein
MMETEEISEILVFSSTFTWLITQKDSSTNVVFITLWSQEH